VKNYFDIIRILKLLYSHIFNILYNTKKKKIKMISEAKVHHRRF